MTGVQNRRVLVTGCGSAEGIGFAIARAMALGGAQVFVAATTTRILQRRDALLQISPGHHAGMADLSKAAEANRLVAEAFAALGGIDVLVNNAGLSQEGVADRFHRLEAMSDDAWRHHQAINLDSAFYMTRAVLPLMQAAGYGRIVNLASVTGPLVTAARTAGYSAAKAGMVGLTRTTALENARQGITCNAVLPGWIDTGSSSGPGLKAGKATPAGRSGTPDEVAAAAVFLASDAAAYITGTTLVVDGGNAIVEMKGAGF